MDEHDHRPGFPGHLDVEEAGQAVVARGKRTIYPIGFVVAAVAFWLSWLVREDGDLVLTYVYPPVAVAMLVAAVAVRRSWIDLAAMERTGFVLLAVLIMGRLYWHLHLAGSLSEHLLVLTGGHYWAVGILIVAGFVLLGRRHGLIAGVVVLATSVLLIVTGAGQELRAAGPGSEEFIYLARVHGFLLVLLALTLATATMREQLDRAVARGEAFRELATTDPLTGISNRRSAIAALEREQEAQRRYGRPVSLVLLDLDNFKEINDEHGHTTGDAVLVAVAEQLRSSARDADVVARWGGEEFLLILPEVDQDGARALAERQRVALAASRPGGCAVTATFGVATLAADEDLDGLLHRVDELLYLGKHRGRDVVVSAPEPA